MTEGSAHSPRPPRLCPRRIRLWAFCAALVVAGGCRGREFREAEERLRVLATRPRRLERPVVLVHGWLDGPRRFRKMIAHLETCAPGSEKKIHCVSLDGSGPIDGLAERVARECAPLGEVDVIAHSMGNLVARQADGKHGLKIKRLFSLAGPHTGGRFAFLIHRVHDQVRDMDARSVFIRKLNSNSKSMDFKIVTFRVRGDPLVSRTSAHFVGSEHHELRRLLFRKAHKHLPQDERVIAYILEALLTERPTGGTNAAADALQKIKAAQEKKK